MASIRASRTLTRSVLGEKRKDNYLRNVLVHTPNQVIMIGRALGIELIEQDIEKCFETIEKIDYKTTMSR